MSIELAELLMFALGTLSVLALMLFLILSISE